MSLGAYLKGLAAKTISAAAKVCEAPGCKLKSPGLMCADCRVPLCANHAALKFGVIPPTLICAPCNMRDWKA